MPRVVPFFWGDRVQSCSNLILDDRAQTWRPGALALESLETSYVTQGLS